jgi:chaperonin GroES
MSVGTAPPEPNLHLEFSMKFRPLYDRVLIKRIDAENRTASGLIIPDAAKEKPMEGEVVAVGNGRRNDDGTTADMTLNVGDRILFGKYTGDEVKLDGDEHLILKEEDVLAVVERS